MSRFWCIVSIRLCIHPDVYTCARPMLENGVLEKPEAAAREATSAAASLE
jgi:hypothetical protein